MADPEIIVSRLSTRVQVEDITVDIDIYRLDNEDTWTLEIIDAGGGSTVWKDKFTSDQVALDEALRAVKDDGIESFVVEENTQPTIH